MIISTISFLIFGLVVISIANIERVSAQENEEIETVVQYDNPSEHILHLQLPQDHSVIIDENGLADLTNNVNGQTQRLPYETTDKNDNDVTLIYFIQDDELYVYAQLKSEERGWGKCAVGIAGGAISGGTAAGLKGAGLGTLTLPGIGTVGGGTVGAVAGAVGGGLTGGATFC
ncbi:hypothetical protein [Aerococcus kribbianus]|uniref:Uncharacterized protein n=1 Tax=Aerococcus kribbianus TaxID=2999064 RepID=A0A9X3FLT5_9LACT|nr:MULTISPECIES: hypothetical protein [unclassified Aerococcus]MCZ0716740.1 hypothetical protein [Aerococcus sp. YH-aer221]MCZ0725028.1 hypothetical protein [Aerococcus sp. YH-aer222]